MDAKYINDNKHDPDVKSVLHVLREVTQPILLQRGRAIDEMKCVDCNGNVEFKLWFGNRYTLPSNSQEHTDKISGVFGAELNVRANVERYLKKRQIGSLIIDCVYFRYIPVIEVAHVDYIKDKVIMRMGVDVIITVSITKHV